MVPEFLPNELAEQQDTQLGVIHQDRMGATPEYHGDTGRNRVSRSVTSLRQLPARQEVTVSRPITVLPLALHRNRPITRMSSPIGRSLTDRHECHIRMSPPPPNFAEILMSKADNTRTGIVFRIAPQGCTSLHLGQQ